MGKRAALLILPAFVLGACAGEPSETGLTAEGGELYARQCAVCHGPELEGTHHGPTFLDPIYAPNHHPDETFRRAVREGVVPHHWNFGPMPPVPGLSDEEMEAIIAFIRERQRDAGITHDPNYPQGREQSTP